MANYKIDTAALFKQTFGFAFRVEKQLTDAAIAKGSELLSQQISKAKSQTVDKLFGMKVPPALQGRSGEFAVASVSYLGTPILMPVQFGTINWRERNKLTGKIDDAKIENDYVLPATTVVELTRQKRIAKTDVQGRDTSVKELISNGDWMIKIRGLVINEANPYEYPEDEMKVMHRFCEAKTSIPVTCKLLQWFEINELVVENYSFPRMEGYPGVQPFELDCLSDEPLELIVKLSQSGI